MAKARSHWCRRPGGAGTAVAACLGVVALLGVIPGHAYAQDDDADATCRGFVSASARAECLFTVGASRLIQPRLALAMFGANPVPGTASTLGMRLGSLPRLSLAFRATGAPSELPPILDRTTSEGGSALLAGFAVDASMGLLAGFSPVPTIGGVLSVDVIGRLGFLPLPGEGFQDGGALGWGVGARVGALRESFTLPAVAVTATYTRIGEVTFGDPDGTTDGFFEGPVSDLRAELAATKRLGPIGFTGGVAFDRYRSDLAAGFRDGLLGQRLTIEADAATDRWSAYGNAAWTLLIFQGIVELGWQDTPVPEDIPAGIDLDPIGWFGGLSFRISI